MATVRLESTIAPSGSVAGPNRVPGNCFFLTCVSSLSTGPPQADVDVEQDGRSEDGPSALDAELDLARPGGRRAMGACSSERG